MGTPILVEFKDGVNPYAEQKPAQVRRTQSQMRADKKQSADERMWARADAKATRKQERAVAEAKRKGEGLVLKSKPKLLKNKKQDNNK